MFLSNLKLSTEEDLVEAQLENETPIEEVTPIESAQDEVSAAEEAEEFQETVVAAEEAIAEMENQEEVLEGVEETSEVIEQKLETPEEVTPEDVVVAQEAFAYALGRLSGSSDNYKEFKKSMRVSYESNNNNPAAVLRQLHTEGFKEFIEKIIASIQAIFVKIGNFIKTLMLKIVAIMDQSEKTLKKLEAAVQASPGNPINKEEWEKVAKKRLSGLYNLANIMPYGGANKLETMLACSKDIAKLVHYRESIEAARASASGATAKDTKTGVGGYGTVFKTLEGVSKDGKYTLTIKDHSAGMDPIPGGIVELVKAQTFKDLLTPIAIAKKYCKLHKEVTKTASDASKKYMDDLKNLGTVSEDKAKEAAAVAKACKVVISHGALEAIKTYTYAIKGVVSVISAAMRPVKSDKVS